MSNTITITLEIEVDYDWAPRTSLAEHDELTINAIKLEDLGQIEASDLPSDLETAIFCDTLDALHERERQEKAEATERGRVVRA